MVGSEYSSLLASVAASPAPPPPPSSSSSASSAFSPFRSLRSLLPFGPSKSSSSQDVVPSASRSSFSSSSVRLSFARDRDRERKTSLTKLLPVISVGRSSSVTELGQLNSDAPILRSISPGPPLSADLSTIVEADSSGVSKSDQDPDVSLDLNTNKIATQVYNAIVDEKDQWSTHQNPIVIDAEDTDDTDDGDDDDDDDEELTEVLPPKLHDNTSINIENVDPSIVALLSPNSLPKSSSPAPSLVDPPPGGIRRTTSTPPSSIPRLRPIRMPSYSHSPLSSSPAKPILPHLNHNRSSTPLTRSHNPSSAPPTPSNRLQVHHPTSSSSETHLRTPSPAIASHSPLTPQLVSTSTSSVSTAPNTPHSSSQNLSYSRGESSIVAHRFRAAYHHETSAVSYGRASLDSTTPPRLQIAAAAAAAAIAPDHQVLATSTPFRRSSEDVARRRREREREEMPPPTPQFRSRKRSMSVQESFRTARNIISGRRAQQRGGEEQQLLHHTMNAASRSHSSLSGRAGAPRQTGSIDEEDPPLYPPPPPPRTPLHQRPPLHDWLGPRSVKALRAAGLVLDDRERDRELGGSVVVVGGGRTARERSGSVVSSVMSSGSGKTTGGGGGGSSSAGGRNCQSALGHGRAPSSRMAFSDAGGAQVSRRASASGSGGTVFSHLMHSPTLTTSTSAGSRDGKERDNSRSVSTAPTSVSGVSLPSMVYNNHLRDRDRDRDEIQEMKERHSTETAALLNALSDSQRTTRVLREENYELRSKLERMEEVESVNEDLRIQMRSLRREVGELKIKLHHQQQQHQMMVMTNRVNTPVQEVPTKSHHHRRCPSDASSIFPVVPSNMTMLMHDEDHMHEQLLLNGDEQQGGVDTLGGPPPTTTRSAVPVTPATVVGGMGMSVSPSTVADFSMMTGSPGSLFLRPEHEVHLGDLETFSLGDAGLDDW